MAKEKNFYVVYDNEDNVICCGNIHEVAEYLGIKEFSVRFRTTPTYKKRRDKSKNKLGGQTIIVLKGDNYETSCCNRYGCNHSNR